LIGINADDAFRMAAMCVFRNEMIDLPQGRLAETVVSR
jgi:hypothetical protein